MVTPAAAAILNRIDRDQLLADLSALIRIRSLGGHETPAQEWMAARLRSLGLAVDDWTIDIDRLRGHPAFSMEVARDRGLGVAGTLGDGDGSDARPQRPRRRRTDRRSHAVVGGPVGRHVA